MQQKKRIVLILCAVGLLAMLAFAGCGNTMTEESDSGTVGNGTTATDADREIAENELKESNNDVAITLTSPQENAEIEGGTLTVSGKVDSGEAKEVQVKMMLPDDSVIGEGKALVADVSHEFTVDIPYTIPAEKAKEKTLDCKVVLTATDTKGNTAKEETVKVKVK